MNKQRIKYISIMAGLLSVFVATVVLALVYCLKFLIDKSMYPIFEEGEYVWQITSLFQFSPRYYKIMFLLMFISLIIYTIFIIINKLIFRGFCRTTKLIDKKVIVYTVVSLIVLVFYILYFSKNIQLYIDRYGKDFFYIIFVKGVFPFYAFWFYPIGVFCFLIFEKLLYKYKELPKEIKQQRPQKQSEIVLLQQQIDQMQTKINELENK